MQITNVVLVDVSAVLSNNFTNCVKNNDNSLKISLEFGNNKAMYN